MQRVPWADSKTDETVLQETDVSCELIKEIRYRQLRYIGRILKRNQFGKLDVKTWVAWLNGIIKTSISMIQESGEHFRRTIIGKACCDVKIAEDTSFHDETIVYQKKKRRMRSNGIKRRKQIIRCWCCCIVVD